MVALRKNASPEVVKLLLDHKSDTTSVDEVPH
jgi:hypothetical protein